MSTAYFPGWGTVHMWDKSQTFGALRRYPNRRAEAGAAQEDDILEENDDYFPGRASLGPQEAGFLVNGLHVRGIGFE